MKVSQAIFNAISMVEQILQVVDNYIIEKFIESQAQKQLAKYILLKSQQSIQQIMPIYPNSKPKVLYSQLIKNNINYGSRPMTAKIHRIRRYQSQSNISINSPKRKIKKTYFKRQLDFEIKPKKKNYRNYISKQKTNYVILNSQSKQYQQPQFDILRLNKISEEIKNNKIKEFFKTLKDDVKSSSKLQSHFNSFYGSKNITYTYKGDLIDLNTQKVNNIKRINSNRIVLQNNLLNQNSKGKVIQTTKQDMQKKQIDKFRNTLSSEQYSNQNIFQKSKNTIYTTKI